MSYHQTTICGRCSKEMELAFYEACPYCKKKDDVNVNYTTIYNLSNARLPEKNDNEQGIYRFRDFFALGDSDPVISIGEGDTPLRRLHKMGGKIFHSPTFLKVTMPVLTKPFCPIMIGSSIWSTTKVSLASNSSIFSGVAAFRGQRCAPQR